MWKRSPEVPFPSIWSRFERVDKKTGAVRKFFIQDITDDMHAFIVDHMSEKFTTEEPLCSAIGIIDDPESVASMSAFWRAILRQHTALVCFEEDPKVPGEALHFVGCNVTIVCHKDDNPEEQGLLPDGDKWKKVYEAVITAVDTVDVFKHFGIETYLSAFGLSVKPSYRGLGIGLEILNARTPLCKALGIPLTETAFTNIASQILAERSGFQDFINIDYEELRNRKPHLHFPGIKTKTLRVMYKKIN